MAVSYWLVVFTFDEKIYIMERFDFEKLEVWQDAVDFSVEVILLLDTLQTDRKHYRLIEQMESAASSIS